MLDMKEKKKKKKTVIFPYISFSISMLYPSKIHVEAQTPMWQLWEGIRTRWGHEGGAIEAVPFLSLPLIHWGKET